MRFGASTRFFPGPMAPEEMIEAVARHRITSLYTAPTAYRTMADIAGRHDLSSLAKCVSAGETLPRATWEAFHDATGIPIVDGLGSTEMLHIFVAERREAMRAGFTGRAIPGYRARIVDEAGRHPAARRARAARGAGAHGLPLSRRRPTASRSMSGTAGTTRATSTRPARTAISAMSRGPTT